MKYLGLIILIHDNTCTVLNAASKMQITDTYGAAVCYRVKFRYRSELFRSTDASRF